MRGSLAAFFSEKMALWSLSGSFSFRVGLQFLGCAEQMNKTLKAGKVELPVLGDIPWTRCLSVVHTEGNLGVLKATRNVGAACLDH